MPAFHATFTPQQAEAIANAPGVALVEENGILSIAGTDTGCGTPTNPYGKNAAGQVIGGGRQYVSRWGMDRTDQIGPFYPPCDGNYTWCSDGGGVSIYVVDTGVLPTHSTLYPRVVTPTDFDTFLQQHNQPATGTNCWQLGGYAYDLCTGQGKPDCYWAQFKFLANASHGTSVASVAAGLRYGVARALTREYVRSELTRYLTTRFRATPRST